MSTSLPRSLNTRVTVAGMRITGVRASYYLNWAAVADQAEGRRSRELAPGVASWHRGGTAAELYRAKTLTPRHRPAGTPPSRPGEDHAMATRLLYLTAGEAVVGPLGDRLRDGVSALGGARDRGHGLGSDLQFRSGFGHGAPSSFADDAFPCRGVATVVIVAIHRWRVSSQCRPLSPRVRRAVTVSLVLQQGDVVGDRGRRDEPGAALADRLQPACPILGPHKRIRTRSLNCGSTPAAEL